MCGLFGWQWKDNNAPNKQQRNALVRELAQGMDKRGGQAWGVWSPNMMMRGLGKAEPQSHRFAGLFSAFGHCRLATHGANTLENAHPFVKDGVALAHNGVISNHDELNTQYQRGHAVDSQHLLSHMLEGKPFTEIQAYGAICWSMPQEPNSIYMGRLSARGDLVVAQTERGVIWASTDTCVRAAAEAGNLKVEKTYQIDVGMAYFAKDGKFFYDEEFPSLKVSEPQYYQHWASFPQAGSTSGGRWMYKEGFTRWCNKHKRKYQGCPCRPGDPDIYLLPDAEAALLKEGDTCAIPKDQEPKPTAPSHSSSTDGGGRDYQPYFCTHGSCMARNPCPVHGSQSSHEVAALMEFCPAIGCIALGPCPPGKAHEYPAQLTQKQRTTIATMTAEKAANDQSEFWATIADMQAAEDKKERDIAEAEALVDLAELWLEAEHNITPAMTNGMTRAEIFELAVEEGFDAEAASVEAIEITIEEESPTYAPLATSDVQQPSSQYEPANWGAIVPVGGRSDD